MSPEDQLDAIWGSYVLTKDCFKSTRRIVNKDDVAYLRRTVFVTMTPADVIDRMTRTEDELADFTILAFWTVLERYIIEYIQLHTAPISTASSLPLGANLYSKVAREAEYWRIDDIFDLLKRTLDSHLLGHIKSIKAYRDWVVHKNPTKPIPARADPEVTYNLLKRFFSDLRSMDASAP